MSVIMYLVYDPSPAGRVNNERLRLFAIPWKKRGLEVRYVTARNKAHRALYGRGLTDQAFSTHHQKDLLPQAYVSVDGKLVWARGNPAYQELSRLATNILEKIQLLQIEVLLPNHSEFAQQAGGEFAMFRDKANAMLANVFERKSA